MDNRQEKVQAGDRKYPKIELAPIQKAVGQRRERKNSKPRSPSKKKHKKDEKSEQPGWINPTIRRQAMKWIRKQKIKKAKESYKEKVVQRQKKDNEFLHRMWNCLICKKKKVTQEESNKDEKSL